MREILRFAEMEPRMIERECGGWLAVSPDRAKLHIGVVGDTEIEAWRKWKAEARAWEALAAQPPALDIHGYRDDASTSRHGRPRKRRRSVEWLRKKYLARARSSAPTPQEGTPHG